MHYLIALRLYVGIFLSHPNATTIKMRVYISNNLNCVTAILSNARYAVYKFHRFEIVSALIT